VGWYPSRFNASDSLRISSNFYIGLPIEKLHIENSHFINQRVGHHIKSRALTTELINNVIEDGPEGNASFLVDLPNGGTLVMRGNTLEKGPHSQNRTTVIAIGEEHRDHPSDQILIENNKFTNDANGETAFVRNFGASPVTLRNNQFTSFTLPAGLTGLTYLDVSESPATNIALALAAALAFHILGFLPANTAQWVADNLKNALLINVVLAVFNMLPIPPLDGGRVAVGLLPNVLAYPLSRLEPYGMLILIGILIILPLAGSQFGLNLDVISAILRTSTGYLIRLILVLSGNI